MLLARLARAVPGARLTGSGAIEVADLSYTSNLVHPGDLFVAVPKVGGGPRSGGWQFINEAATRGAVAVAGEEPCDTCPLPFLLVRDARAALADLAAEFFGHPTRQLDLLAVTGTDGKTTTTYLLEQILRATGRRTGLIGTVHTAIAGEPVPNPDRMTTPESLDLQRLLAQMLAAGVSHVAVEASSHALALERLRGCRLAARALTNITADHLEFHGSAAAYTAAKLRLFTELGEGRPAVLNADDASFADVAVKANGPVLSYGLGTDAALRATDVKANHDHSIFTVRFGSTGAMTRVPLAGTFNISNGLAALGLALVSGTPLTEAALGLAESEPPPGRSYRVQEGQPFDIVIDYAHTENAFRQLLATVRGLTPPPRRVIAVFGAAGNRDRAKRPGLAQLARRYTDFFVITNEDPFDEAAGDIIAEIAAGAAPAEAGDRYVCQPDRGAAIAEAIDRARPGDAVVLLGKGHERSIMNHGTAEPWSDEAAVRNALRTRV